MRRAILSVILILVLAGSVFAVDIPLKATWSPNTETDMKEYRLYRTDGTRDLIGTIPHPTATYNFSVTVPEGTTGTLKFVLTAVDTSANQSLDSVEAVYPFDFKPPVAPHPLGVTKQ